MQLKKSLIKNWWIAPAKEKMQFVNIFNDLNNIDPNLVVMGYLHNKKDVLASSTNRVTKIVEEGVITAQGTFYPFEEAHPLYLKFLILANNKNTIIANRWEFVNKGQMVANLIWQVDKIEVAREDVYFDFQSKTSEKVLLSGYSEQLNSAVVLSPFNIRNQCLLLGVQDSVLKNIWKGSIAKKEETRQKIKRIHNLFY